MRTAATDVAVATVPVLGYWLKFDDERANAKKEYRCFITDTNVGVTQWGRQGTEGQSKAAIYPTYAQAESAVMKDYHAKAHKGYRIEVEGMRFLATEEAVERARQKDHSLLVQEFHRAHASGEFTGKRDAVFKHYDEFTRKSQDLLDAVATGELTGAQALEQIGNLMDVWSEITERHDTVATTLRMAQSVAMQKLAGR